MNIAPGNESQKALLRMLTIVTKTEEVHRRDQTNIDLRNLSYYRGSFWGGDGIQNVDSGLRNYASAQNEIFPVIDSLMSAMAQDIPACEILDQRASRYSTPDRIEDPTMAGRSLAAVHNLWSAKSKLDRVCRTLVLHAACFRYGVAKTIWSPEKNRPETTMRLPWAVHFDPTAETVDEAGWAFERFTLHVDEVNERIKGGAYKNPGKPVEGSAFPRSLLEEEMTDEQAAHMREAGLNEYVSMVEFWDFRKGRVYHIDTNTKFILLDTKIQWGNPYTVFTFHDAIGRIEGIPDVSLIADKQRDVNELTSARREVVRRLAEKIIADRAFFQDDADWNRYKDATMYTPVRVHVPPGRRIEEAFAKSPSINTGYDFNASLDQDQQTIRRTAGVADFERGVATNIRTAAEANMILGAVGGRTNIRMKLLVEAVEAIFALQSRCWKWALKNPKASKIDMEAITFATQRDISADVLTREALEMEPVFRILPFSPLMEDKHTKRQHLVTLVQSLIGSPLVDYMDLHEYARELVDQFGLRPSIVKSPQELAREQQMAAEMAAAQGAAPMPEGGDGAMLPGMESE